MTRWTQAFRHLSRSLPPAASALCCMVLLAQAPRIAGAVDWLEETTITEFPMWSLTGPAAATGDDGRTHIVWSEQIGEDQGDQLFYRAGHGTDWDPIVQLSDSWGTANPTIAIDAEERIHVAWADDDDGQQGIFYRRYDSGAWTPAIRLNDYEGRLANHPRLAAGPDGAVHIVWDQGDSYPPPAFREIFYARWDGTGWSEQEPLTANAVNSVEPAMAVAPNGDVHVLWQDDRTGTDRVYHRRCVSGAWSPEVMVGDGSTPMGHPDIAVTPSGGVHAVMERQSSLGLICYSRLNGTAWSEPVSLTENPSSCPKIAGSRCEGPYSDLHIVWQEYASPPQRWIIVYRNIHGTLFGDPETVTTGEGDAVAPAVAVDPICNIDVVWRDNRESPFMQGVYHRSGITSPAAVEGLGPVQPGRLTCAPNPARGRLTFRFLGGASGLLRIFDASGRLVRALPVDRGMDGAIEWDGCGPTGEPVRTGVYYCRLEGSPGTGRFVQVR